MDADLRFNLILYIVPIISFYFPIVFWSLAFAIDFFKFSAKVDQLSKCVSFWVLFERLYNIEVFMYKYYTNIIWTRYQSPSLIKW